MKISILQEHLNKALVRANRVISTKTQMPILQNVFVEASSEIKITAMSLEMTEIAILPGKVTKEGGVCVPAKLFLDFVSTLPQEPVEISLEEGGISLSCGGSSAVIPTVGKEEFPPVSSVAGEKKNIEGKQLLEAISSVVFSAATDDSRPILTGVCIVPTDDETTLVATDGYRLSVSKISGAFSFEEKKIIPARALSELVRIVGEEKEQKGIDLFETDEKQVAFRIGDTTLITRPIDGEYPNYEKIIPKTHTTSVIVQKTALMRAVKSAAIFAKDNANIVKLHLDETGITASANTPSVGKNTVLVPVEISGDGGDIAFNSRFLLDFFSHAENEEIIFEMTGSLNPGVFRCGGNDGFLHIIMPVRVQG
jgi:DNA polymerase-3 subunit beta